MLPFDGQFHLSLPLTLSLSQTPIISCLSNISVIITNDTIWDKSNDWKWSKSGPTEGSKYFNQTQLHRLLIFLFSRFLHSLINGLNNFRSASPSNLTQQDSLSTSADFHVNQEHASSFEPKRFYRIQVSGMNC